MQESFIKLMELVREENLNHKNKLDIENRMNFLK